MQDLKLVLYDGNIFKPQLYIALTSLKFAELSFLFILLQTVSTANELRKPVYWIVAAKAIDYEQMLLLMANVKWDVKEIMSQHNVYVDSLLKVNTLGETVCQSTYKH